MAGENIEGGKGARRGRGERGERCGLSDPENDEASHRLSPPLSSPTRETGGGTAVCLCVARTQSFKLLIRAAPCSSGGGGDGRPGSQSTLQQMPSNAIKKLEEAATW